MGRKSRLSSEEIGQIKAYHDLGPNYAQIGRRINRSKNVVRNYLRNPDNYGKKSSPGRPRVFDERPERQILRSVTENNQTSIKKICQDNLISLKQVCTVQRIFQKNEFLVGKRFNANLALLHVTRKPDFNLPIWT